MVKGQGNARPILQTGERVACNMRMGLEDAEAKQVTLHPCGERRCHDSLLGVRFVSNTSYIDGCVLHVRRIKMAELWNAAAF